MSYTKHKMGFSIPILSKITRPSDNKDKSVLSVVLFNQSTINEIVSICKPAANSSEFQVHYRALVISAKKENVRLTITIPTVFYNFPQKVSGSAVDYHLKEVEEQADKGLELSQLLAGKFLKELPVIQELIDSGVDVNIYESNCGSIHRHPGDFGFSSTDYDKDPEHPGVIYRNKTATDHIQSDSVIYIPYGEASETKIVTTETRIVNTKGTKDGGVEGTYTEVPTFTIINQDTVPTEQSFSTLLGLLATSQPTTNKHKLVSSLGTWKDYPVLVKLREQFLNSTEIKPNILLVEADNIEQQHTYYGRYVKPKKAAKKGVDTSKEPITHRNIYDFDDDEFEYYGMY
jgi:hypothetical protein